MRFYRQINIPLKEGANVRFVPEADVAIISVCQSMKTGQLKKPLEPLISVRIKGPHSLLCRIISLVNHIRPPESPAPFAGTHAEF